MPYSKTRSKKQKLLKERKGFPSYDYAMELKDKLIEDEYTSVIEELKLNTNDAVEKFLLECLNIVNSNETKKIEKDKFEKYCKKLNNKFFQEECIYIATYILEESNNHQQIEKIVEIIIKKDKMPKVTTLEDLRRKYLKKN